MYSYSVRQILEELKIEVLNQDSGFAIFLLLLEMPEIKGNRKQHAEKHSLLTYELMICNGWNPCKFIIIWFKWKDRDASESYHGG